MRAAIACMTLFAGFAAWADTWTDPSGDVASPNADIISGSLTVSDDHVDLRIQFSAAPYPTTHTHSVTVCFDTDQNSNTGYVCGAGGALKGADQAITIWGGPDALITCSFSFGPWNGMLWGLDPGNHLWFDSATNTLRLLFPRSRLPDDGTLNYIVESAFGGSFGANERVPNAANFSIPGNYLTHSGTEPIEPFAGVEICKVQSVPVDIDIVPGSDENSINLCSGGATPVAILSRADFDATLIDPESLTLADAKVRMVGKSQRLLCHQEDSDFDGLIDFLCQF